MHGTMGYHGFLTGNSDPLLLTLVFAGLSIALGVSSRSRRTDCSSTGTGGEGSAGAVSSCWGSCRSGGRY
ncbi:hypothetical protein ACFQL1_17710 [Halomicroarcula sp. GCM10025709]|uniref:hypothetical protein n=1 Tax=Halomicroarcula sp. GCM10025709 TaxID=3252669 RepID=UPI00361D2CA5